MDCKNEFLSKVNINILWDIIYENIVSHKNNISLDRLKKIFSKIITHFGTSEKIQNLFESNKKFITMINNEIKEETNNSKPLITYNDIQKDRTNLFEKQLIEKQNDFNNLINIQVPSPPNFKDDIDKPIGEIDSLIKRKIEERNLDIIKINSSHTTHPVKTEQFLKSSNTSIKSENIELKKIKIDYLNSEHKIKNFNVTDLNIVDIDKKVTWNDEVEVKEINKNLAVNTNNLKLEHNFLSKLKVFETTQPQRSSNEIIGQNMELSSLNAKIDMIINKLDLILSSNKISTF